MRAKACKFERNIYKLRCIVLLYPYIGDEPIYLSVCQYIKLFETVYNHLAPVWLGYDKACS